MLDFLKLKEGSVLSELRFYKVAKIKGDKVQLIDDGGVAIVVDKWYAEKLLLSAEQFTEEVLITRTELIERFLLSTGVAITANYYKQVKKEDVLKEILEVHANTAPKDVEKAFKASVKKAMEGEERTIIGRHYGTKDDFGRIHFIDMEITKDVTKEYDTRQRLVDVRTLNWFICRGAKYIAKR